MKVPSTLIACLAGASFLLVPPRASAQLRFSWNVRPLIRYIEGKVLMDGQSVALEPDNSYLPDGHVLGTAQGRVQTSLASAFRSVTNAFLAENSSLKLLSGQLPDQAIEVLSGSVILECRFRDKEAGAGVSVTFKDVTIDLSKTGEYRIDADLGRLRVYSGEATVTRGVGLECVDEGGCRRVVGRQDANTVQVHKGEQLNLDETLLTSTFDTKDTDVFYHWARHRLSKTPGVLGFAPPPSPRGIYLPSTENASSTLPGMPPNWL
ncbi:MAG TPA: hypothetical protein VGN17_09245 [Bryobacteraceae bacterium]|jgi:hypothetical protein